MKGYPCFPLAVYKHPVDRAPATISGKERPVKIEAPGWWDLKYARPDHIAVVKRKEDIRLKLPDFSNPYRMVDIIWRKDRDILRCGKLGNRIEPDVFHWIILVGKNHRNLETITQQCFDADTTDVMISKDYSFHIFPLKPNFQTSAIGSANECIFTIPVKE
jgi:hypothetical protein